ncbi:MAG: alanine racemase [Rhodospirillales bacterium]|nr:alanine racemase [Rhodospirillales bacterium]
MHPSPRDTAVLTIDLDAITANYQLLATTTKGAECAAVVKADAYGLGVERVAPALAASGCKTFFVATIDEGIQLRSILPKPDIHVLNGIMLNTEDDFIAHNLIPVLNSLTQIEDWKRHCGRKEQVFPADIHFDTGMNRLGLTPNERFQLYEQPDLLTGMDIRLCLSHLACADVLDDPMNERQLTNFMEIRRMVPIGRECLANSSGIYLSPPYHLDMVRPGCALYGINPRPEISNPMAQAVHLQGKILQVRDVDSPMSVGYGASHKVMGKGKIATVAVGYADGYLRSLGGNSKVSIGDFKVPVVGRVSMDLITIDVTNVPENTAKPGAFVDVIGPHNPVDVVAKNAGTIGYEILTSLGNRYHRLYVGGKTKLP